MEFNRDASGANKTYPAGSLFCTLYEDENHPFGEYEDGSEMTREYRNNLGQVILKETFVNEGQDKVSLATHYIYDERGLLMKVIPPKAADDTSVSSAFESDLCYTYTYDFRKRMTSKKLPGQEIVYMVYDNKDRLVLTQDGNLRDKNKFLFTKYDVFNRPVITGLITIKAAEHSIDDIRADFENENRSEKFDNNSDTSFFYTHNESTPAGYKVLCENILTVTWYDDYDFISGGGWYEFGSYTTDMSGFSDTYNSATKGMVTGTMTKALPVENGQYTMDNDEIITINYYDDDQNVIRTITHNHMGDYEVHSTLFKPICNWVDKTKQSYYTGAYTNKTIEIENSFVYDKQGRLLETTSQINDEDPVVLSANQYNELGQVEAKFLHSKQLSGSDRPFAQEINYQYNLRGWLTHINQVELGGDNNDVFGMQLYYGELSDGAETLSPGGAQYNGNIAAIKWNSAEDEVRGYGFSYDEVNRLKLGTYAEGISLTENLSGYDENIGDYDKNGNILSLTRKFRGATVDYLSYGYSVSGNQLQNVTDSVRGDIPGVQDYVDLVDEDNDYDGNGNLIKDIDKNIDIVYNILNLPSVVIFDGGRIFYYYDAAGNKLAQEVYKEGKRDDITDYTSLGVFKDKDLSMVYTEEGRAVPYEMGDETHWHYEYYMKDHLGNTRVVFGGSVIPGGADILQVNNYYPFGMPFETQDFTASLSNYHENKYLYNGKELQTEGFGGVQLDWFDYGARFYDPSLGRWHVIDNKAEKYYGSSPYVYTANNPIRFIDPDGNDWWDAVVGTAIGVATNIVPGSTSLRNSYTPTDAADYNNALRGTDDAAMVIGEGMVKGGGGAAVSGLAVATVAATASLAVVDAPVTVPVAGVALTVAEVGAVTAAGGSVLMANGSANAAAGYNYGEKPKGTKHTDNRHVDRNKYPNKSKYKKPNQRSKLEGRTMKNYDSKATQTDGRVRYDKQYDREIGTKGETGHRVVVDPKKNKIVTSFPQK